MENKNEGKLEKYQGEIAPAEVYRSEVNFLTFPYFSLWDKDIKERRKLEVTITTRRNNAAEDVYWGVYAHQDFGFPGPFDKKVHMAVEQVISELPLPISNPIPLGSFRSIAARMGVDNGGKSIKRIKESLERIVHTAISSKNSFYDKGSSRWVVTSFHLYDQVVFAGEDLSDGGKSDNNFVYLCDWYLNSINAKYVKPIDWTYIKQLGLPIATRLYELLGVKFYGLGTGDKFIRYKYSTLCDLLPVRRQQYLSQAQRNMNPALDRLKETQFLSDYSWQETYLKKSRGRDKDWYIIFYPGERALNEIRSCRGERMAVEEYTVSRLEEVSVTVEEEIRKALFYLKVSPTVINELVETYDVELIGAWINEVTSKKDIKEKAAYLVKALREGWNIPERQANAIKRAKEEADLKEREEAEKLQFNEEEKRLDRLFESQPPEVKVEMEAEIECRIPPMVRARLDKGDKETPLVVVTLRELKHEIVREWSAEGKL